MILAHLMGTSLWASGSDITMADEDKKQKNLGGRPPAFTTPEEMEAHIGIYFDTADPPTVAGLAFHLGFTSRQSIYDYEVKADGFAYIIKRARLLIEEYHEKRLSTATSPTGSIFWAKNHGWSDRTEIVGKDGGPLTVKLEIVDPKKSDQ